jgi:hypothetical protein
MKAVGVKKATKQKYLRMQYTSGRIYLPFFCVVHRLACNLLMALVDTSYVSDLGGWGIQEVGSVEISGI